MALTAMTKGRFQMPLLGLGTYQSRAEECYNAVLWAIQLGYRHIDTAGAYRNEKEVGRAIRDSGVPRSELFVTTKLGPKNQGFDAAYNAGRTSLQDLGLEYIDLYLIHWPGIAGVPPQSPENRESRIQSWKALQRLKQEGIVRAIGVSNFLKPHLEDLLAHPETTEVPVVNQVEYHPMCQQGSLKAFCTSKGIHLEAYASLGQAKGELIEHSTVATIAARHNKTPAQILLRWAVQQDVVVIPKSIRRERIEENSKIFDFELSPSEMESLSELNQEKHFCWDPNTVA
eukprot:GILK01007658.1.p1 GENE.GILK01007658.1~~GILK01007658.1.p1  ORF type:complete len:302 (+),score=45.31 GILK01007658.1:50-907(+)